MTQMPDEPRPRRHKLFETMPDPKTFAFIDDGLVPNNPLPFLLYESAIDVSSDEPEAAIEKLFAANGWGQQMWRNGVFDFLHYHATVHEALGIARGHARVQFGGDSGVLLDVKAGDVVVLPAGTGHRRMQASKDLSVVGGYPPGATMTVTRPTKAHRDAALTAIRNVKLPTSDPVNGPEGPLIRLWTAQRA